MKAVRERTVGQTYLNLNFEIKRSKTATNTSGTSYTVLDWMSTNTWTERVTDNSDWIQSIYFECDKQPLAV